MQLDSRTPCAPLPTRPQAQHHHGLDQHGDFMTNAKRPPVHKRPMRVKQLKEHFDKLFFSGHRWPRAHGRWSGFGRRGVLRLAERAANAPMLTFRANRLPFTSSLDGSTIGAGASSSVDGFIQLMLHS